MNNYGIIIFNRKEPFIEYTMHVSTHGDSITREKTTIMSLWHYMSSLKVIKSITRYYTASYGTSLSICIHNKIVKCSAVKEVSPHSTFNIISANSIYYLVLLSSNRINNSMIPNNGR